MAKAKQITVMLANRPGALAEAAGALGRAKVNILAFTAGASGSEGYARFVVDSPARAKKAFSQAGLTSTEQDVQLHELPDKPGALGEVAGKLGSKGTNIAYGYSGPGKGARRARVVLAVD